MTKSVIAPVVGRRGKGLVIRGAERAVPAEPGDRHIDIGQPRLVGRVLHAVAVGIEPDKITQRGRTGITKVLPDIGLTDTQRETAGVVVAAIAIEGRIKAHPSRNGHDIHRHRVVARNQIIERVIAVHVGRGGRRLVAHRIAVDVNPQRDVNSRQAAIGKRIERAAVTGHVQKHGVTDRSVPAIAKVLDRIVLAGSERYAVVVVPATNPRSGWFRPVE